MTTRFGKTPNGTGSDRAMGPGLAEVHSTNLSKLYLKWPLLAYSRKRPNQIAGSRGGNTHIGNTIAQPPG